jgi:hypothetical protein
MAARRTIGPQGRSVRDAQPHRCRAPLSANGSGACSPGRYVSNDMLRDHIFLLEQPRHRSLPASQSSACQRAHVPMAAAREGIGPSASTRGDRPTDRSNPRRMVRRPTDRRPGSASVNRRYFFTWKDRHQISFAMERCAVSPYAVCRMYRAQLGAGRVLLAAHCRPALYPAQHGIDHIAAFLGFRHHFKMSFSMPRRYSRCLSVAAAELSRGVASACQVVCRVCRLITTRPGHGRTARPTRTAYAVATLWVGGGLCSASRGRGVRWRPGSSGTAVGNAAANRCTERVRSF